MRFSLSLLFLHSFIYLFIFCFCLLTSYFQKATHTPTTQGETSLKLAPIYGVCFCQRKIPLSLKKSPLNLWLIHHSKAIGFETEAVKAIIWIPFYWVPTYPSLLTFLNSKSSPSQDTVFIKQTIIFGFRSGPFHGWILRPWKTCVQESCGYSCNAWAPRRQSDKLDEADVMNSASPALAASTNVTGGGGESNKEAVDPPHSCLLAIN